jgi:hypothetical protein
LYFSGYDHGRIVKILELNPSEAEQLRIWVEGKKGTGNSENCWEYQVKIHGDLAAKTFLHAKSATLEKTAGIALGALSKGLKKFTEKVDGGYEPKTRELKDLADIVASIDKIWRLENEQATDIIAGVGFTREEAIRIIKADPFAPKIAEASKINDAIPTEFKEIE